LWDFHTAWALSGGWEMSAIPPLSGDKQTSGERVATAAFDPLPTCSICQDGVNRLGCDKGLSSTGLEQSMLRAAH
jgi:hypothetical protein